MREYITMPTRELVAEIEFEEREQAAVAQLPGAEYHPERLTRLRRELDLRQRERCPRCGVERRLCDCW